MFNSEEGGCTCQRCGRKYQVDLIVDDDVWEQIKPLGKAEGAGLLCGPCIMERVERISSFDGLRVRRF